MDWPPQYCATIRCEVAGPLNAGTSSTATPELTGAVPSTVRSSKKVTRPLGFPPAPAAEVTTAVSFTICPADEGFGELVTVVKEASGRIFVPRDPTAAS